MIHYLDRLQSSISSNWDRPALCDYKGGGFTFGELAAQVARLHVLFEAYGVRKGDKIAICARNQARWAVSFIAASTFEAIAVPILSDFTPEGICSIVDHSESVLLFTDPDIWKKMDPSAIPAVRVVISVRDFSILACSGQDALPESTIDSLFSEKYPDGFSSADIHYPTDNGPCLAVINYTSGSTGDPKGVMLRHECFSANIQYGQDNIPSYPGDSVLSILPMAHMFGLVFEMLYPLCGGSTVYYLGKTPSPTVLLKAMQEVRPYIVIAVPMIFEKIYHSRLKPELGRPAVKLLSSLPVLRRIVFSKMRRSIDGAFGGNVREYVMGGAALNPEVEAFLQRIGLHFTVGYGMTEAAPLLAFSPWDRFAPRSCGRAMDYVELRIDSEDPEHKVGQIQARGTSLLSGYFRNDRATAAAFTSDGWFNTGDLGLIDRKGNVYIKGRCKSLLLSSNGQNIYPEEIESEINAMPYVIESLVVSRGGKLTALLYLDGKSLTADGKAAVDAAREIRDAVNARIPRYSQISQVELRDEPFQKTPKLSIKRFLYS